MEDLKTILWLCMLVAAFLSGKMLCGMLGSLFDSLSLS